MIDFSNYNAIVVGCGLMGGIAAHYLAGKKNMSVLILKRRNHIGGNIYDSTMLTRLFYLIRTGMRSLLRDTAKNTIGNEVK